MENKIVIKQDLKQLIILFFTFLLLGSTGVYGFFAKDFVIALATLFLIGAPITIWKFFSHKPSIVFSKAGIIIDSDHHRNLFVTWDEVEKISYQSFGDLLGKTIIENLYLAIYLKHPDRFSFKWSRNDATIFLIKPKQPTENKDNFKPASIYVSLSGFHALSQKQTAALEYDFMTKLGVKIEKLPDLVSSGGETAVLKNQESNVIISKEKPKKPKFSFAVVFKHFLSVFFIIILGSIIINKIGLSVAASIAEKIEPFIWGGLTGAAVSWSFFFPRKNKEPEHWLSIVMGTILGLIFGFWFIISKIR